MVFSPVLSTILQLLAIVALGLVVGTMFGIWRGYDLGQYSPAALVEVHQGAVRGLNVLLPAMGLFALLLTIALAVLARGRAEILWLYIVAALLIAVAALITRLGNQPINEQVMTWSADALPENWQAVRDAWSNWHLVRLGSGAGALVLLTLAILNHRDQLSAAA